MSPTAAHASLLAAGAVPHFTATVPSDAAAGALATDLARTDAAADEARAAAPPLAPLALSEGTVYALLGRNGAGKSSLVRCLLGQQRPAAGRAMLFGRDAWRHRASLMAQVGVVPEQPDAPPGATARRRSTRAGRAPPRACW